MDMNKIFAVVMTAMFLIFAPAFAGAQVLHISTTPEEWPKVFASWKSEGAVSQDESFVSANVIGHQAFIVAQSQGHPAASLGASAYVQEFLLANPALMPEQGVVKLDNFLTLARAGRIQHPEMAAASATQPAAAVVVPVIDDEARFSAEAANRTAENAVKLATDTIVEVERLETRLRSNIQRVDAQGKELSAGLAVMQEAVDAQGVALATQASSLTVTQDAVGDLSDSMAKQAGDIKTLQQGVTTLAAAPPKPDWIARIISGLAIILLLILAWLGYTALASQNQNRKKEGGNVNERLVAVETTQVEQQSKLNRLDNRTAELKDIQIDHETSLRKRLEALSGGGKLYNKVVVEEEEFTLLFEAGTTKGMVLIHGIEGQQNEVSIPNVPTVITRAARGNMKDRVNRIKGVVVVDKEEEIKDEWDRPVVEEKEVPVNADKDWGMAAAVKQ